MNAILFGSIGTIVDTSELQRKSFNQAFIEHGLDWNWDQDEYTEMLSTSGGRNRIAAYAEAKGQEVDADAVHASKSTIFQTSMDGARLNARPGVADTIRRAKDAGVRVGLVTTTSNDNVSSMVGAIDDVQLSDFDVTISIDDVEQTKPDPAAYAIAVERLELSPTACVAVEDNVDGVASAVAAGITCVAFPNENTADHDFSAAAHTIDSIDFDEAMKHAESN